MLVSAISGFNSIFFMLLRVVSAMSRQPDDYTETEVAFIEMHQRIATLEAALAEAHRVILHELDNGRTPYLLPIDNGGKGLGYFEDVLAGINR